MSIFGHLGNFIGELQCSHVKCQLSLNFAFTKFVHDDFLGQWHLRALLKAQWSSVPVSLGREGEDRFGCTTPAHQAASTEVKSPSLAAFFDELLNGNWLNDGVVAQCGLLLLGQLLRRVCRLTSLQPSCGLLCLSNSDRWLRCAVTEVSMLQSADVFTHTENSKKREP